LAGALARTAAKYDIGVQILFYHSSNHYIRLYATVNYGAKKANTSLGKMGYIQHCFACFHRRASTGIFNFKRKICPECGKRMSVAGPLWVGKIAEENFVIQMEGEAKTRAFRQKRKIRRLLALIEKEAKAPITYYRIDKICDKLNLPMPPTRKLIEKLKEEGYKITLTHFKAQGIKTDAPAEVVTQVIKNLQMK
jgi:tRNA (guanine26-N2/guanine27-N2)-dimethyltransferase